MMSTANATPTSFDVPFERDRRHVEVAEYTTNHLLTERNNKQHTILDRIHQNTLDAGLPNIACVPAQAKFLMLQVRMLGAKNVLEIGTLGGYSAAWMALAGPDVKVTTIEVNQEYAAVAADNIELIGLSNQVEIIVGAGLDVLPLLQAQVESGERPNFDFVFIDANKQDNLEYFNFAVNMINSRAAIIVDNVVRNGKVASEVQAEKDTRVSGTRWLIEEVGKDSRVDATVLQTVDEKNYDGFLLAVKR